MPPDEVSKLRSFSSSDRFVAEIKAAASSNGPLRPGYVLAGDEIFLYERCRRALVDSLIDPTLREFSLSDLDLAETSIFHVLDLARTPSLMAPFQVIFVRNLKNLFTRGAKKEEFAALKDYFRSPNPQAVLIFVADHLRLPADLRRMDLQDKERYERIRETLGDDCGLVELARVDEADAVRWLLATADSRGMKFDADAARELADALGADMMLISSELEKLMLYASDRGRITLGDVETMVLAAKQRSLYELTDAISARDKPRALALLHGLLNASDGERIQPSGISICWRGRFARWWSSWRKMCATHAPSGRRCGKVSACLPLPRRISFARLAAIARGESSRKSSASSLTRTLSCGPRRPISGWCWSAW